MQNWVWIAFSCSLATSYAAPAAADIAPMGKSVGVGLELGAPTNLNLKFITGPSNGIVVGVGGGVWYDLSLSLHLDYLWHPATFVENSSLTLTPYIGIGGWTSIATNSDRRVGSFGPLYFDAFPVFAGLRVPLGLSFAFNEFPMELFIEAVPAMAFFPFIGVFGQGGIGGRFYF